MTTECTVVFRPTVRSLITLGYEQNRSGACHGSLGRSNRVTFYPKKESLSQKKNSPLQGLPILLITNYIPSQIFIYSLILMVVPPFPTIQHIPMSNSLLPSSSCHWLNSFVAMSHSNPNFEHPSHLFEAVTGHNSWTVGRNTTALPRPRALGLTGYVVFGS